MNDNISAITYTMVTIQKCIRNYELYQKYKAEAKRSGVVVPGPIIWFNPGGQNRTINMIYQHQNYKPPKSTITSTIPYDDYVKWYARGVQNIFNYNKKEEAVKRIKAQPFF